MTRLEYLQTASKEDIASLLCDLMDNTTCGPCQAQEFCRMGHTGFEDWLEEEQEE